MRPSTVYDLHGTRDYARSTGPVAVRKSSKQIDDHPDLVNMCLECTHPVCKHGDCEMLRTRKATIAPKNRSRCRMVEFRGETVPLRELCAEHNLSLNRVITRMQNGWSLEEALGIIDRKGNK